MAHTAADGGSVQTSVPNISMHVRNMFAEGELRADSVVKESLTTAADGKDYTTRLERVATVKESLTAQREGANP